MAGSMPLLTPHSIYSTALTPFILITVMRFRWCAFIVSPSPSPPRFVVAKMMLSGCNSRPPILRSFINKVSAFFTSPCALPYSSIITATGPSKCKPNSSCVTILTYPSVSAAAKLGNAKSPRDLVVASKYTSLCFGNRAPTILSIADLALPIRPCARCVVRWPVVTIRLTVCSSVRAYIFVAEVIL